MAVMAGAMPDPRTKRFKRNLKSGLSSISSSSLSPTTCCRVCMHEHIDQRTLWGEDG